MKELSLMHPFHRENSAHKTTKPSSRKHAIRVVRESHNDITAMNSNDPNEEQSLRLVIR